MIPLRWIELHNTKAEPGQFPWDLPAVVHLERLELTSPVTLLVGENGSGKSTLIEAIAIAAGFNAEGGTRYSYFRSRAPTETELYKHLTLAWDQRPRRAFFLRAETFFNLATAYSEEFHDGADSLSELHSMSHGEQFLTAIRERFGPGGLFLMDEPESALSFTSQLALMRAMHEAVSAGSQFIVATHSPVLVTFPGAVIWHLDADGMRTVNREQAPPYQEMRAFLADPDRYLHYLFFED